MQKLKTAVSDTAEVEGLTEKSTIELRDLDAFTTQEEVEVALKKIAPDAGTMSVTLTKPNSREQMRAFVKLSVEDAAILLRAGKLR